LEANPNITRRELSRRICELNDRRSPNGNLKDMSCRKALVELDRRGAIALPLAERVQNFVDPGAINKVTCLYAPFYGRSFVLFLELNLPVHSSYNKWLYGYLVRIYLRRR